MGDKSDCVSRFHLETITEIFWSTLAFGAPAISSLFRHPIAFAGRTFGYARVHDVKWNIKYTTECTFWHGYGASHDALNDGVLQKHRQPKSMARVHHAAYGWPVRPSGVLFSQVHNHSHGGLCTFTTCVIKCAVKCTLDLVGIPNGIQRCTMWRSSDLKDNDMDFCIARPAAPDPAEVKHTK